MKKLSSFILLIFFCLIAGGSADDIGVTFAIIGGAFVVFLIGFWIYNDVQKSRKNARLQVIANAEKNLGDFDTSMSVGDDECMLYFDSTKRQVMVMTVDTDSTKKNFIDDFTLSCKEHAHCIYPYFTAFDAKQRKIITGDASNKNDVKYNCTILTDGTQPLEGSADISPTVAGSPHNCFVIDELHGLIVTTTKGKIDKQIDYLNGIEIQSKPKKSASIRQFLTNTIILDDFYKIAIIHTRNSVDIVKYSDIVDVTYEEDGNVVYTKSATRTVGGALVGGALLGGAGAVVGGLSGDSKEKRTVTKMDLKILIRNTDKTSITLHFNLSTTPLNLSNGFDKQCYDEQLKEVNGCKDLLSIIIDSTKNENRINAATSPSPQSAPSNNIADELSKLAKLRADGILTDEEFAAQKTKLLGL